MTSKLWTGKWLRTRHSPVHGPQPDSVIKALVQRSAHFEFTAFKEHFMRVWGNYFPVRCFWNWEISVCVDQRAESVISPSWIYRTVNSSESEEVRELHEATVRGPSFVKRWFPSLAPSPSGESSNPQNSFGPSLFSFPLITKQLLTESQHSQLASVFS